MRFVVGDGVGSRRGVNIENIIERVGGCEAFVWPRDYSSFG